MCEFLTTQLCVKTSEVFPQGSLLANFHYLNLNHLMSIRSSSGFSHLQPGAFHITLQTHKTQHTQPKRKKRVVFGTFLGFCASVLSRACARTKFAHSYQECRLILSRSPTRHLVPQVSALHSAAAFLWLSPFSDCRPLLSSVDCSRTLPFLVFFRSRRKSLAKVLWVGFTPKQTKESFDWGSPTPTPVEMNSPPSCHTVNNYLD